MLLKLFKSWLGRQHGGTSTYMDWKTASTLKTLGNERAIAVPVVLDELLLYTHQDGQSPIEAYGVRDLIESKLSAMLGAVSLLQNHYRQPSAMISHGYRI